MNDKIDGQLLRAMIREAARSIEENKQRLNDLNVFPVPDGDTGTNMGLTIGAAASALESRTDTAVSAIADTAAMALLRGARGNSGVILSLLFRGFSKTLKGCDACDGLRLADALANGSETAYKAVMKPTEGTILTVARVAAEAAQNRAMETSDPVPVLAAAFEASQHALYETTAQNPVLARANVVDAGGAGWVVVLSAMLRVLRGEAAGSDSPSAPAAEEKPATAQSAFETSEIRFAYCTEFIVNRSNDREPGILRGFLEGIGDCVVVVDDDDIIKVHVHTNHPGQAIEEALTFGSLDSLKIENMRTQHSEKILSGTSSASAPVPSAAPAAPAASEPAEKLPAAFVAVVAGDGLANVFRDLGVQEIVEGGQTMNPSTTDILDAVERAPSDVVYVLPNNKNIIMAAQQAAPLTKKTLFVLPTVSVPQGITAMLAYDESASAEENRDAMEASFANTHTASLTYAARDSVLDDRQIRAGDYLALMDGKLVDALKTERDAVAKLARDIARLPDIAYVTVFYGSDVDETAAQAVREAIERECPGAEVSAVYGGQPIYYYIISAE